MNATEAMFWKPRNEHQVRCTLCPQFCLIPNGETGFCGVRKNQRGHLRSLVYGRTIARDVDPIEKKPLYHFLPNSRALSVATVGCNFRCRHCQNMAISQASSEWAADAGEEFLPAHIVQAAKDEHCESIAYTYTEPTVFFEYAFETAQLAASEGIRNLFVTNGFINAEPLRKVAPYLHAANVDLKAFRDWTYRELCSARLQPVLDAIRIYRELGVWLEVTTLVIPGCNDSAQELREMATFLADVDPNIPWHLSRFFPAYQMENMAETPFEVLEMAQSIGQEAGLKHVYMGNVNHPPAANTYCPECGKTVLERGFFGTIENELDDGACPHCGTTIAGIWS